MIDQIIANKPDSIFDVIPESLFEFDLNTDYGRSGNCWEWNYAVAKAIRPTSYIEIGVRFSYSFIPTLIGAGDVLQSALGIDLEEYGNNIVASDNIKKYYRGNCDWRLVHADSQQLTELDRFYDLYHIDGCHTKECKMHDLRLGIDHCRYMLVDDYDYMPDVRPAVNQFIEETGSDGWGRPSKIEWACYLPTFRGAMLIKFK